MSLADRLGHPPHPLLVHFPVALWTVGTALVIAAAAGARLGTLAWTNIGLGCAFGLLAAVTGAYDALHLPRRSPAGLIMVVHAALNVTALALFFGVFLLGLGAPARVGAPHLVLALSGFLTVTVSGYLGGTMVFNHAASVNLERARRLPEPQAAQRQRALLGPVAEDD